MRAWLGARLLAQGRTDDGRLQLQRALTFHRLVRATRYVAEAEALLVGDGITVSQQTTSTS